jgi:small GTP-binding protein
MELKCKISLLGNEQVGKTSLILRYIRNTFSPDYKTTLGADFIDKEFSSKEFKELKEKDRMVLTIWDLAGQAHFEEIASLYIHGSAGIILVFDVNNPISLESISKWKKIAEKVSQNAIFICVGNKSDLRPVSDDELKAMEEKIGMPIVLASAKTAANVGDIFEKIARKLLEQYLKKPKK